MSVEDKIAAHLERQIRLVQGRDITPGSYVELDGIWVKVFSVESGIAEVGELRIPYLTKAENIRSTEVYRTLDAGSPFKFIDGLPAPVGWPSGNLIYVEEAYKAKGRPYKGFSETRLTGVYVFYEDTENGKSYYIPAMDTLPDSGDEILDEDYDLILGWHPVDIEALEEREARRG